MCYLALPMVVRTLAVGPGVSYASWLSFAPGHNFRFMTYKTGTARMPRQGMKGKMCREAKARGVYLRGSMAVRL